MKKFIITFVLLLTAGILLILPACAKRTPVDTNAESPVTGDSKVLVAYMSWSGHLRTISGWVADETKGDLFRILTVNPYPEDYSETTERAKEELEKNILPELSTHIPQDVMAKYDTVYIGFPIWWYDVPMPVRTFAKEYDFSGKRIIPFFSHEGTSDGANSQNTLKSIFPNSNISTDILSIRGSRTDSSEAEVRAWVKKQQK